MKECDCIARPSRTKSKIMVTNVLEELATVNEEKTKLKDELASLKEENRRLKKEKKK